MALCLAVAACSSSPKGNSNSDTSGGSGGSANGGSCAAGGAQSGGSSATGGSATLGGASNGGGGVASAGGGAGAGGDAPFVLDFGPNVLIFDPATPMATSQGLIDAAYMNQSMSQFGDKRYAFLFKPGAYQLDVKVGYYTQALGLGQKPDDVQITGAVRSTGINNGNATLSFWRGAENLSVVPMPASTPDMWAVSQGASFRRMHVFGSLILADAGNSSAASSPTAKSKAR